VTREEMADLVRAWEALDAAAQRVETAQPLEMSAAIAEQTTQRILFRTRLFALVVHAVPKVRKRSHRARPNRT
jgi:hypothetical protein